MHTSLSVRRAWIEILYGWQRLCGDLRSLSVRRAWIEIDSDSDRNRNERGRSP